MTNYERVAAKMGLRVSRGARKLSEYTNVYGERADLARKVRCGRGTVTKLCDGRALPGLALAVAIERETGIAPHEWVER